MLRAYDIQDDLIEAFGVPPIDKLGCIMLQVEKVDVSGVIPKEWEYVSPNPSQPWIRGLDGGDHVTLLYGLLKNGNTVRPLVDKVLEGWELPHPYLNRFDFFDAPQGEPYSCIVAHVRSEGLLDAHRRLSLLPHINTFQEYQPHLTLCYVKKEFRVKALTKIVNFFAIGRTITPVGIDYGDPDRG